MFFTGAATAGAVAPSKRIAAMPKLRHNGFFTRSFLSKASRRHADVSNELACKVAEVGESNGLGGAGDRHGAFAKQFACGVDAAFDDPCRHRAAGGQTKRGC